MSRGELPMPMSVLTSDGQGQESSVPSDLHDQEAHDPRGTQSGVSE